MLEAILADSTGFWFVFFMIPVVAFAGLAVCLFAGMVIFNLLYTLIAWIVKTIKAEREKKSGCVEGTSLNMMVKK